MRRPDVRAVIGTARPLGLRADARRLPLPDGCVDLIVTSPPYFGLRSYTDGGAHYAGQIGSEATPAEWLASLVECTREWVRVLKPSGSIFVNLGDKFSTGNSGDRNTGFNERWGRPTGALVQERSQRASAPVKGLPPKSLLGLPWRYALACMDELGLILRRDIIWSKPNGLPESVTDRCRSSHEYVFHLVKQPRYYAAVDEIREPQAFTGGGDQYGTGSSGNGHKHRAFYGAKADYNPLGKLPGSVWSIPSQPLVVPAHLGVDHFAAFPLELPRRIIAGWSPPGICTACGEGRRPVVDKRYLSSLQGGDHAPVPNVWKGDRSNPRERASDGTFLPRDDYIAPGTVFGKGGSVKRFGDGIQATITGYACACPQPDAPATPAVVLDPFAGTGTTMLAASALGRIGIGCDLSMDYARLARWRTQDRAEIAKAMQVPKPPAQTDGQDALFGAAWGRV